MQNFINDQSVSDRLNYSQYLIYGQSDGNNLLGFKIDVNAYICDDDRCEFIADKRHEDTNCMLTLFCKFVDTMSHQQIADYLQDKWLRYIRYLEFEKHYIEVVDNQLIFYYVTCSQGLGVTGKVVAT